MVKKHTFIPIRYNLVSKTLYMNLQKSKTMDNMQKLKIYYYNISSSETSRSTVNQQTIHSFVKTNKKCKYAHKSTRKLLALLIIKVQYKS